MAQIPLIKTITKGSKQNNSENSVVNDKKSKQIFKHKNSPGNKQNKFKSPKKVSIKKRMQQGSNLKSKISNKKE